MCIRDSNKQSILTGIVGYRFSQKTRVDLKFDSASVDYIYNTDDLGNPWQNDYKYTTISVGIDYEVTGKLSSKLYVGSTSQNVDLKNIPSPTEAQKKEYSGVTASGSLAYKITPKMMLSSTLLRDLQYNAYVNYLIVNKITFKWHYQLTRKIRVSVRGAYETNIPSSKITNTVDKSTKSTFGVSARYDVTRYLSTGLDYENTTKSSKIKQLGYANNVYHLFVTLHF